MLELTKLYCDPTGHSHNPEPLKEHLTDLSEAVKSSACDLGIVVDPDVDRLAFMNENGEMFGEEYTLRSNLCRLCVVTNTWKYRK